MSRGLTTLESRLGVRLVTRTSRSLELTEEGQLFYERCARIVADIADAEAEASSKGATIKGMVRIGGPMELGRRLVAPLVTEFRGKFPDVQVHLVLSDSGLDVIDDGLDVALRVGLPSDSNVIARRVLTAKRITCASPAYFKEHGTHQGWNSLLREPHAIQRCNRKEIQGSEAEDSAVLSHWDQIGG